MNWKEISEQRAAERRAERAVNTAALKIAYTKLEEAAQKEDPKQKKERFILANYMHLTLGDMAEELDCSYQVVAYVCRRLGVEAISEKDRNEKFILEMYLLLPKDVIAKRLDLGLDYLGQIYRDLDIKEPKKFRGSGNETDCMTPGKILSQFQLDGANHYEDIPPGTVLTLEDALLDKEQYDKP